MTYKKVGGPDSRAALLWVTVAFGLAAQAITEQNPLAHWLTALMILGWLPRLPFKARICCFFVAAASLFLGPLVCAVAVIMALSYERPPSTPMLAVAVLLCAALGSPLVPIYAHGSAFNIAFASVVQLGLPVLAAALVAATLNGIQILGAYLLVATAIVAILAAAAFGDWLTPGVLASGGFRTAFVMGTLAVAGFIGRPREITESESAMSVLRVMAAGLASALVVAIAPARPIDRVSFDEAHGAWETINAPFGPNAFGRDAYYTYSFLPKLVRLMGLKASIARTEDEGIGSTSTLFVMKMPTRPITPAFQKRLSAWVHQGGRLLVVADHTDLFDTTQRINAFLPALAGITISSTAVFDKIGNPDEPMTPLSDIALGRIDADGQVFAWQTGTSIAEAPVSIIPLATYGMSFAEPGRYDRPNRFGLFQPRLQLPFANHAALVASCVGDGCVFVLLDSTPWSNFSVWQDTYRDLLAQIIRIAGLRYQVAFAAWGFVAAAFGIFLLLLLPRYAGAILISGIVLGAVIGAYGRIGLAGRIASHSVPSDLRVVLGPGTKTEILKPLVPVGVRNFTRIISSLGKYGFVPSAGRPGSEHVGLSQYKNWLAIEPDSNQLPEADRLLSYLRNGGNCALILSRDRAIDPRLQRWLARLGLQLQSLTALGIAEDARPSWTGGLFGRRGPELIRDTRPITVAVPSSPLKEYWADSLFQTYTARPTTFPPTSGHLAIGFSADQFSDDAIGEVWEGIQPNSLGKLRERQLVDILHTGSTAANFPSGLKMPSVPSHALAALNEYAVLEDGHLKLRGHFKNEHLPETVSPSKSVEGWLAGLRDQVGKFLSSSCSNTVGIRHCTDRMLSADGLEWIVTRVDGPRGISKVELLHDRRFSSVGATWNVIFSYR